MDSVKEIIIALGILVSSGYGLYEAQKTVKQWAIQTTNKGMPRLAPFTKSLTGLDSNKIEKGEIP